MNEREPFQVLDELGRLVPDRRPPISALMRDAKRARIRRGQQRLAVGAAFALTFLAGAMALMRWDSSPTVAPATQPGAGPVISVANAADDFPLADVSARLTLSGECLMLDGSAVFWPVGTTWDPKAEAVVFPPDFEAPPLEVGDTFTGAGGSYTSDQATAVVGDESRDTLLGCIRQSADHRAVFAVPYE